MLRFAVLASGSKGNSVYVEAAETRLLIDCGISAREAGRRLTGLGIDPETIRAILVTHEHRDHVSGIPVFCKKKAVRVFMNRATHAAWHAGREASHVRVEEFVTGEPFEIGDLRIEPFSISHDAAEPVGFVLRTGNEALGLMTDLGHVTTLVREKVRGLDALILESNHDPELLHECAYPWELKQRILSRTGHLSNQDAAALVSDIGCDPDSRLQVLVGAHVSENSNIPELVDDGLRKACATGHFEFSPEIVVAAAAQATRMFEIQSVVCPRYPAGLPASEEQGRE